MDDEAVAQGESKIVVSRGVVLAIVAVLAFSAGLLVGGQGDVRDTVAGLPIIGDGLDPTPAEDVSLQDFWKAWNALGSEFVITQASSSLPTPRERVLGAIQGLAASYGDPYTVFLPPEEAKAFAESIAGSFAGVGMEIGVKEGVLTVVAPLRGTPAERAGIQPGDLIIAIDGKSTDGLSTEAAVRQIRGPAGTSVKLTLIREQESLDISIVRDTIEIPEIEDGMVKGANIYRIALFQFTANSPRFFAEALSRFRASGAEGLVLDLRGNPGGYLEVAVDMASYFLPKGAPVVTEDFGEKQESVVHTSLGHPGFISGTPLAVLINSGSASASEIVAGALQDTEVATIVGETSFGKGSVQALIDLGGGSLKVTVARWITPDGNWIMDNGVTPDIEVAYSAEDARAGRDPQLDRAVRFLTTGK